MATANIQSWQANLQGKIHPSAINAFRLLFDAIQDHDTAIVALDKKTAPAVAASTTNTIATAIASTSSTSSWPYQAAVNRQSGAVYGTQPTDNGGLVVLNYTGGAIAVTLSATVAAPYFVSILNLGTHTATLTPSTGTINGLSSASMLVAGWAIVYFDGTNFWSLSSPVLPVTTAAIAHEWLASYNAITGAFTATQPAFTDISGVAISGQVPALSALSGQITTSQLPSVGLSVTITTAKLTTGGTNGSMTFTSGILTAQTPAT